jgi:hypothetical protein
MTETRQDRAMALPKKPLFFLPFVLSVVVITGCRDHEQYYRKISPDGLVEAIIYRCEGREKDSFGYDVYIVPNGKKPHFRASLFSVDHARNISISWQGNKMLEIHYDEAQIHHFQNFWNSKAIQNSTYVVELKLYPNRKGHGLSKQVRFAPERERESDEETSRW